MRIKGIYCVGSIQSWFLMSSEPGLCPLPRSAILWVFCCIRYLWEAQPALPCLPACLAYTKLTPSVTNAHTRVLLHTIKTGMCIFMPTAYACRCCHTKTHLMSDGLSSRPSCVTAVCACDIRAGVYCSPGHEMNFNNSPCLHAHVTRLSCSLQVILQFIIFYLDRWTVVWSNWKRIEPQTLVIFPLRLSRYYAMHDHRSKQGDALVFDWSRGRLNHSWFIQLPYNNF